MSMELESDDFASESASGSDGARAVTVGAVLAAATPLHWDEAVAILQELVDVLTSTNRDDIPAFDDVLIDADGTLTIRGTRRLERGPIAAGRALHTLLATADVPVALRLFVTQANVPETHHSLAAFGKGLAYFGKSDRAELIRAVYARYKPAVATAAVPPNGAASPPPPRTPPPSRSEHRLSSRGTFRRALVAAAIIVCLASGGAIGWILFTRAPRPASVATPQAKSASPVSTARPAKHAADSSATRATNDKATASDAPVSPPRTVQPSVPLRQPVTLSRPGSIVVAERREGIRADPDPTPVVARTDSARTSSPVDALARDTPPASVNATREAGEPRAPAAIYSGDDRDVQPPLMLSPQLPPLLMIGGPSDGRVNRMELVVATDGSVERVRLIGAPSRMADMMLLSGAKLWKFTPAIKDGVPVRYRTMVSWMVFP